MDRFRLKLEDHLIDDGESDFYSEQMVVLEIRLLKKNCFKKYIWKRINKISVYELNKIGFLTKNQVKIFLINDFKTKRNNYRKQRNLYKLLNK